MTLAIIGGTGLTKIDDLNIVDQQNLHTPYGTPSAPFQIA